MLQPALLAVIRSGRQEKYPNGLHQAGVKDSKTQLSCGPQDGSGTTPPRTHMPMATHLLKPSKEFRVNNLCNDSLHPRIYRDIFFFSLFGQRLQTASRLPVLAGGAGTASSQLCHPLLPPQGAVTQAAMARPAPGGHCCCCRLFVTCPLVARSKMNTGLQSKRLGMRFRSAEGWLPCAMGKAAPRSTRDPGLAAARRGCPWGEELPMVCFPLTAVGRSRAFRHTSPAWKPEFLIFHRPAHSAATAASSASET